VLMVYLSRNFIAIAPASGRRLVFARRASG
jgi:hypothetical protein